MGEPRTHLEEPSIQEIVNDKGLMIEWRDPPYGFVKNDASHYYLKQLTKSLSKHNLDTTLICAIHYIQGDVNKPTLYVVPKDERFTMDMLPKEPEDNSHERADE